MTRSCVGIVLAVALVAGAATTVRAQGLTGQISGTITDTSGGVLPGVTVVAIQTVDLRKLDANLFTKAWLESKSR